MRKKISIFLAIALFLGLAPHFFAQAAELSDKLSDKLKGRILLQVESKGEAWYVDAVYGERVFLGRPDDVFRVMKNFGLGVKQAELQSYLNSSFPARLAGKILLNVEGRGEAYYVAPDDLKGYYLGKPSQAFQVIKEKAIGITNNNLNKISVGSSSETPNSLIGGQRDEHGCLGPAGYSWCEAKQKCLKSWLEKCEESGDETPETTSTSSPIVPSTTPTSSPKVVNTCTFWTYSDWSGCVNDQQTRSVLSSLPTNCTGGQPEIVKSCSNPVCSSWYYSDWHNCSGGYQLRDILQSFPTGCVGGEPNVMKSCSNNITCTTWTYSDWSPCSASNIQTRTALSGFPDGCYGGQPVLTQSCTASSTSQYSPYQFSYAREMGPLYDPHVRIVFYGTPNENIKIIKIPITAYYGYGTLNDTLPSDLEYSVNYLLPGGGAQSVNMTRLNNRNYLFEAGTPIPLNLGDNNSLTIKANKSNYSAINDVTTWTVWDYSTNKPVWTGN